MTHMPIDDAQDQDQERIAIEKLRSFFRDNRELFRDSIMRWGGGNGEYILEVVRDEIWWCRGAGAPRAQREN